VEIECLPADLPEYLEVDVSALPLNGLVHLSEIKLPKGVTIPALAQGPEHDQVVASIHLQRVVTEDVEEEEGVVAPAAEPGAVEGGE
jgi:large subunit ribosomal protein L25